MMKVNLYSDLGDFEQFNLFDFGQKKIYLNIGKLCRHIQLPDGFAFPVAQILGMWSLFAKYEGMDETKQYYKYSAPTVIDKKYQAQLYFGENDKKLKKIVYNDMTFRVDVFETCSFLCLLANKCLTSKIIVTESSEVFKRPENCGPLKPSEVEGFGKLMSGLISGFQKSMGKTHKSDF